MVKSDASSEEESLKAEIAKLLAEQTERFLRL
jgi:hypothetical protein